MFVDRLRALIRWVNSMPWKRDTPWKLYGKQAGYLRNEQMAQNADALAAFWNGESRGTKHMIELAKRYGLKVRVKRY